MKISIPKIILFIFNTIGLATLFITIVSITTYLIKYNIISLKHSLLIDLYYVGIGVILYYLIEIAKKSKLKLI